MRITSLRRYPPEVARLYPRWEDIPLVETKPFYSDLLVDDEGNLWVLEYPDASGGQLEQYRPRVGNEPEIWSVFSRDGALQASVEIPSGLRLQAVAGGYVIGTFRDDLDVEVIRLYRLLKAEEENGRAARVGLALMLPLLNRWGGKAETRRRAVSLLEESKDPARYLELVAERWRGAC